MIDVQELPTFAQETGLARMVHTAETGWIAQRRANGEIHRPAKNYRVTSPEDIGRKLTEQGFQVERCLSLFSHGRFEPRHERRASPWKYGMEVLFPGLSTMARIGEDGDQSDYRLRARILLANNGREALRIGLGALRLNCTNQFTASLISIRHTDAEIDGFLDNPGAWLFDVREHAVAAVKNLHALRGIPADLSFFSAVSAPRLGRKFMHEVEKYHREENRAYSDPWTFWTLAQALTGTRSPRLVRASMHLLQAAPEALVRGECPAYFKALAVKN